MNMSNGDLERMVYNGTMDMATYNWWLNFLSDMQQLGFYLLMPVCAVGALLLGYWCMHKLLTRKGDKDGR
jgi:hypothetical protein